MTIGVMQPYFFPYLGYFHHIHAAEEFVIYGGLKFVNRSWVSRNAICGDHGKGIRYIRPDIRRPPHRLYLIDHVQVADGPEWRTALLRALQHFYHRAAHFDEMYPFFKLLIDHRAENLSDFNAHAIREVCRIAGLSTTVKHNSPVFTEVERELDTLVEQYREMDPGIERRQVRVLEICKRLGADHYMNPVGGSHLYPKELFERHGVHVSFVKSKPVSYAQFADHEFIPNLSVIDVLMHVGPEGMKELVTQYELM